MRTNRFLILLITLFGFALAANAESTEYKITEGIQYYPDSSYTDAPYMQEKGILDVYCPKAADGVSTVVWFHGGGLKFGKKEIPERLKEQGICVVGVNYRLSPNVNAPKYIEDAAASVAWVFNNIKAYGGDPDQIFISGYSAGGYLVNIVGLDKRWLGAFDIDANRIAGIIALSGQTVTHQTIREERNIPDTRPIIDELAPVYHIRSDAPPLLLITGDRNLELAGRYEENAYLASMMKSTGHKETRLYELDGYGHGILEPALPLLLNEIKRITGNE